MDSAETAEAVVDLTEEDDCVLVSLPYNNSDNHQNNSTTFKETENKLVAEFLKKCINMENSQGMERIVNNIFMKLYSEANEDFKMSTKFNKYLRKTLYLLDTDPYHKFSHIKNLCEKIKAAKVKKRVQLITLESNVKEKQRRIEDVINLVENDEKVFVYEVPIEIHANKENNNVVVDLSNEENALPNNDDIYILPEPTLEYSAQNRAQKITEIENEIRKCKQIIEDLDSEEVTVDSNKSPYIRSESLKAKIVTLYGELCQLTGHEAVKKRRVRLKVLPGHPKGPVKRLERFLNRNIGKDGDPPFPDLQDVVKCVSTANEKDSLGWNKSQIMREATALFTQCGLALQKRRQNRDWRDLLCKVKLNDCPRDPADDDPQLLARLEANKLLAQKKESDVFARYCKMQNTSSYKVTYEEVFYDAMEIDNQSSDEENQMKIIPDSVTPELNNKCGEIINNFDSMKVELNSSVDINSSNLEEMPSSQFNHNEDLGYINSNNNIEDISQFNQNKSEEILEKSKSMSNDLIGSIHESDLNSNNIEVIKEPVGDVIQISQLIYKECEEIAADRNLVNSKQDEVLDHNSNTEVVVKNEPEDIIKTLNEYGENCTLTVILDIEDPFLIIEVSSDSSEDGQD